MAGVSSQASMQAATSATGVTASSQMTMQAAFAPPSTRRLNSSLFQAQADYVAGGMPAVSQSVVLVAYRVSPIENFNARAWEFTLDGHTFYVVTLGEQGTWVYDMTTGQWAEWETAGLGSWNMDRGLTWKGDVIAADRENAVIWRLDPTSFIDDDFKTQTRVVTGGVAIRGRDHPSNYSVYLTASKGNFDVGQTLPATLPTIRLEYSDDQGQTYQDAGTVTIVEGQRIQDVQWQSLGAMQAPGRIFRITDTGAVARIDGVDAEIEGAD